MAYGPNCDAEVNASATSRPQCQADFAAPSAWTPTAKVRSERRGPRRFWGGAGHFEYDPGEYEALIGEISRHPVRAAAGLPLFGALFGLAIVARNAWGSSLAGIALIVLLLVFPWYAVQLTMERRMQAHLRGSLVQGAKPSYVPSNARGWVAFYIAVFLATSAFILALDGLAGR